MLLGGRALAADYLGTAPQGDAGKGAHLVKERCAGCHGADGNSVAAAYPDLAGQNYNYLLKELEDFRSGKRTAPPMNVLIKVLPAEPKDESLKDIAAFYSAQKLDRKAGTKAPGSRPAQPVLTSGYDIYEHGLPEKGVPACAACHMAAGDGNAPMAIPSLAGQLAQYTQSQLQDFASGKRHNSPQHIMQTISEALSARQIEAVAQQVRMLHPDAVPGARLPGFSAWVRARDHESVPGIPSEGGAGQSTPSGGSAQP